MHISENLEFSEKNGMKITNTIENLGNTIKYTHTHITFTVQNLNKFHIAENNYATFLTQCNSIRILFNSNI